MSYKQKSLNHRITIFVEKFASNMDFTDSKRLGTRVLCLPHGQCASSLHAKRVGCEFLSLSTANDGRSTHRLVLKTRLSCCHDGRMPDIILARTKTAETAKVVIEQCQRQSSAGLTAVSVSRQICVPQNLAVWDARKLLWGFKMILKATT